MTSTAINAKLNLTLPFPSIQPHNPPNLFNLCRFPRRKQSQCRQILIFRASAADDSNGSSGISWATVTRSIRRGSERFLSNFCESVQKETGLDLKIVNARIATLADALRRATERGGDAFNRLRSDLGPEFVEWNRWERWKDINKWEPKRVGALILYIFVVIFSYQRFYAAYNTARLLQSKKELTEAYMEALIPEPTPMNIRKFTKGIWKKTMPKGLRVKKFIEGPGGALIQDNSFVGEDAWDEDADASLENMREIIDKDTKLNQVQKKELREELGIAGESQEGRETWRERLQMWKEVLKRDEMAEEMDSPNAKYVVDFDMQEVEKSLRKEMIEKASETRGSRALWIAKRWWRYRPKLPYTYFLEKLDCSEVAAVVFSEDLKKLYVTMKQGFPLEYVVDIPLDPYLFETINTSGVEVDLLQKRQIHYFLHVVIALAPGILILWLIRDATMLLRITSNRYLYKRYNQLFDMAYAENFILPLSGSADLRSMSKEVVVGGDVWDLLDEIMMYMRNPLLYYEKQVQFVRGVIIYGPPGTGKTLFARTLAKESGIPFVFASGAEFGGGEKSGAAKIREVFSIARRNAPSFIFVDEIDAIAGRHARRDRRRKAAFNALLTELDGEREKTGVDRFSRRQAVIFMCATNRPDELDPEFMRPGRIDRRLFIGLPDADQRVDIFGVHSSGKQLAEDVDFGKLVFRTAGFSGADIRSLINEAGIMSVRRGHSMITQQDLVDVLDKQLLEGMGVLITEEERQKIEKSVSLEKKRLLAVHEAGHILLAHLFPRFDWHAFSQLLPGGKETAISVFHPRDEMIEQEFTTFGYMRMQMVVAHGGRCAERVVFGDNITDAGKDDLEKITKIAREMVISPRNPRLGLTRLIKRIGMGERSKNLLEGELIKYKWDDPYVIPVDMSIEVSELFTRELTRYIEETEELAMDGLKKNIHILDMIVRELMQNSRVTGLEVEEQMKHLSPVMFDDLAKPFLINLEEEGPLPVNDRSRYQPLDVYPAPLHRC